MWWLLAIAWTIIFLPIGALMIIRMTSVFELVVGLMAVLSSIFLIRIAAYRYIIATDGPNVCFYHKGLFHKRISWNSIKGFSKHRYSPEADLAITVGVVTGGHTRIPQLYVHMHNGSVFSISSLYFKYANRSELIAELEEKRLQYSSSEKAAALEK